MLKNYYLIDENEQIGTFFKELNEKKNTHYIILKTNNPSFVDIRTISLKGNQPNEKLKNLKKPLSKSKGKNMVEHLKHLIESGDRVIETENGYFDIIDGMQILLNENSEFLSKKLNELNKKEIYALNENDKISHAKNIFLQKRVNLLPVIDNKLDILGEVRTIDLLIKEIITHKYDSRHEDNISNLPISNIMNKKPHTINLNSNIKTALLLMKEKKLPSIIITDDNNKIYSVISYKDIFRNALKDFKIKPYEVIYSGIDILDDEELDLTKDYVEKIMSKITKISSYNNLKINLKPIGNNENSNIKKLKVNLLLSVGKQILHVDKEQIRGTSDEINNDRIKDKWSSTQIIADALKTLEKIVKEEKNKQK